MARYPGFVGGSVPARSRTVNSERTVNLYLESAAGTPKRRPTLYNRPGLVPWTYCSPGPLRAMFWQDGRMFVVSGAWFYEVFQSRNVTVRGQMAGDINPATISSNGTTAGQQLFVTSGGNGYIFNLETNAFAQITDTDLSTPLWGGAFLDSYFLALNVSTNTFQLSQLLDGNEWNGLDTAQTNQSSDNKVAMLVSNQKLWLFGTKTTEVWYNSGVASFPFQPLGGVLMQHGIAAPYSAVELDNTVYWLGQDTQGTGIVWRANGYTPERVSTHAIETVLQTLPTLTDALAFSFQMEGHAYYAIYSPHHDTTLLFDIGANEWVEWAQWDEQRMVFTPWLPRCQTLAWGMQLFGSRTNGVIYRGDLGVYEDRIVE